MVYTPLDTGSGETLPLEGLWNMLGGQFFVSEFLLNQLLTLSRDFLRFLSSLDGSKDLEDWSLFRLRADRTWNEMVSFLLRQKYIGMQVCWNFILLK